MKTFDSRRGKALAMGAKVIYILSLLAQHEELNKGKSTGRNTALISKLAQGVPASAFVKCSNSNAASNVARN